jgi:hypothetical protein
MEQSSRVATSSTDIQKIPVTVQSEVCSQHPATNLSIQLQESGPLPYSTS